MNKYVLVIGAMSTLVLAGCQNLEEQLGAKLAEGIINSSTNGEVKVNFDDLKNGKINVTTKEGTITMSGDETGGGMKMTDASGKTVMEATGDEKGFAVKDESGKTVMTGDQDSMTIAGEDGNTAKFNSNSGATRPAEVPADMPTIDGAKDFAHFSMNEMVSVTFAMDGKDLKGNCDKQVGLLTGAGWKTSTEGFNMETSDSIMKNFENVDSMMMLTCGLNGEKVTVGLQKSKKSS